MILHVIPGESKTFIHLAASGIRRMMADFQTKMSIYQSKTNLDVKILSGKITQF